MKNEIEHAVDVTARHCNESHIWFVDVPTTQAHEVLGNVAMTDPEGNLAQWYATASPEDVQAFDEAWDAARSNALGAVYSSEEE